MDRFYSYQEIINAKEFKCGAILYVIAVLAIFICFDASIADKLIATGILTIFVFTAPLIYKEENGHYPWDKKAP